MKCRWEQQNQIPSFTKGHISEEVSNSESVEKLMALPQYGHSSWAGTSEKKSVFKKIFFFSILSLLKFFSYFVITNIVPYFTNDSCFWFQLLFCFLRISSESITFWNLNWPFHSFLSLSQWSFLYFSCIFCFNQTLQCSIHFLFYILWQTETVSFFFYSYWFVTKLVSLDYFETCWETNSCLEYLA